MTPEAKVKKKVVAILKQLGAYYFYPVTGGYGKSGVPDVVGCYRGKFFGIECKAGKNRPSELQQRNLNDITHNMGIALVVNENNIHEIEPTLTREARSTYNVQEEVIPMLPLGRKPAPVVDDVPTPKLVKKKKRKRPIERIPDVDSMTDEELEDWIFSGSATSDDFQ